MNRLKEKAWASTLVLALVMAPAFGELHAAADAQMQGFLEINELVDNLNAIYEQTAQQEIQAMNILVGKGDKFNSVMEAIEDNLTKAVNQWIQNPNEATEAAVARAISEQLSLAIEASTELSTLDVEMRPVVEKIREKITLYMKEVKAARKAALSSFDFYEEKFQKIHNESMQVKAVLEQNGHLESDQIPPELEDDLFKLAVNYQEIAITRDIWQDMMKTTKGYETVFAQLDQDYVDILRLTDLISHHAASGGRILGRLGLAHRNNLKLTVIAKAFGKSEELRAQITETFKRMRSNRKVPMEIFALSRKGMPPPKTSLKRKAIELMSATRVIDFFKNLEKKGGDS